MTDEKSKQLNVRVTAELYDRLKQEADKQEVTLAECVRNLLANDIQSDNKGEHNRYIEQLEKQVEYLQNEMQNERKNVINSVNFLCFLKFSRANLRFFYFPA